MLGNVSLLKRLAGSCRGGVRLWGAAFLSFIRNGVQKRIRRAFLAHPDRPELVQWCSGHIRG
jgi:hypothetical protein